MRLGLRGSTELTRKFSDAEAFGFALGINRSGLAIVDVDTDSEKVVADALDFYGPSPLIARTPSGGYHLYFKHNGSQRRRIRDPYWRERGAPVDVLGNGMVVAPPSCSPKGRYIFVQGGLDDLLRLPVLRGGVDAANPDPGPSAPPPPPDTVPVGRRNHELFRFCMKQALAAGSLAALLDAARSFNQSYCAPPMEAEEMNTPVHSAWRITERGDNHFGQHGAWMGFAEVETMVTAIKTRSCC